MAQIQEWRQDLREEAIFESDLSRTARNVYKPHLHEWSEHPFFFFEGEVIGIT
jgi:hypothetical protein